MPDVRRPALPLPPLIAALRASSASDPDERAPAKRLSDPLGRLAESVGLAGIRLELGGEVDPLRPLTAGWGTLADATGRAADFEIHAEGGVAIGRLWADGDRAAGDEAALAIEAAVQAARAHLAADRARDHLAALDAALHGISGALAVDTVLQLIVDRVRILAGAEYAALGIVGDDELIEQFLTSGLDPAQRERIGALPRGHGLLGLLIREGRSIRIPDIETDPRRYGFPPHHPEMHSFLGVPISVRGRSVGNLYLTNKQGGALFSAADQELVERFALHAGIAIENARLAEQVQQLVVIEERERISADLHDGVIQRIYGVNLSLDEVPELARSRPDEVIERVERAIEALNATIAEIREFIFILRPPGEAGGLGPSLHALAAEVRLQAGLLVEVEVGELPAMSSHRIRELLSIVREALSNAARHANAGAAHVSVQQAGEALQLVARDDGAGFDPDAVRDDRHHGLGNMRRRADQLGGTLQVESRPGAGTRIIVTVPIGKERTAGEGQGRA